MANRPHFRTELKPAASTRIELNANDFASALVLVLEPLSSARPRAALHLVIRELHRESIRESRSLGRTTGLGLIPCPLDLDRALGESGLTTAWAADQAPRLMMLFFGDDETVVVYAVRTEEVLPPPEHWLASIQAQ